MMAIDEQEMRAIAFLAAKCRPSGAKAWDEVGVVANVRKVAHLNLAEVVMATIRAAANRDAQSPGVIPVTTGEHWRERVSEVQRPTPPRRQDQCLDCGRSLTVCASAADCGAQARRRVAGDAVAGVAAAREVLRGRAS